MGLSRVLDDFSLIEELWESIARQSRTAVCRFSSLHSVRRRCAFQGNERPHRSADVNTVSSGYLPPNSGGAPITKPHNIMEPP
jgi:hypothetical protein